MTTSQKLHAGLIKMGLNGAQKISERLLSFVDDLIKWNKVYNLTAIKQPDEIVTQHLLDSISIHPYIKGPSVIDVGTGGGFPGIPLAICFEQITFALLDSNVKKTRFLQQAIINHKLDNCNVIHSRAEDYTEVFDQVVCRAFASLPKILDFAGHLVSPSGQLLAMKGWLDDELDSEEISQRGFQVSDVIKLEVPGLDAQRHLVVLERSFS